MSGSNPLIVQILRQRGRITPRRLMWFVVVLLMLSMGSAVLELRGADAVLINTLAITSGLVLIANPFFVAMTAATVAETETKAEQHELIYISALSNRKLVEGFLFNSLYRCRVPLAVTVGLALAVVIGFAMSGYEYYLYSTCVSYGKINCSLPPNLYPRMLGVAGVAFAIICMNLLGGMLGLIFGLWWRQRHVAGCASAILVGGVFILLFIEVQAINPLIVALQGLLAALIIIGVSLGLLKIAETQARRPN